MTTSEPAVAAKPAGGSKRISSIDWMRGFVMVLMMIDHASMAFDGGHLDEDSALYPTAMTNPLPEAEFFTRWITHICAPTFVFLAGTSLALSIERRVLKGMPAWDIDKNILIRGAIIALMDPTIISLGSGGLKFSVLTAIGLSMICMTMLRRLPTWGLVTVALGWFAFGELLTISIWQPPGNPPLWSAFFVAPYGSDFVSIKYPLFPWLAIMVLGWVFGRHLVRVGAGTTQVSGRKVLWVCGVLSLIVFAVVRGINGYGNMALLRADDSWQQWLHVSKYPPSLTYAALELGILFICLAILRTLELRIGVRRNGILLVFGETAMFYYLVHRLALEIPASYFGLRGAGNLTTTYVVAAVMVALMYPACLWYRSVKAAHPNSLLKYI